MEVSRLDYNLIRFFSTYSFYYPEKIRLRYFLWNTPLFSRMKKNRKPDVWVIAHLIEKPPSFISLGCNYVYKCP